VLSLYHKTVTNQTIFKTKQKKQKMKKSFQIFVASLAVLGAAQTVSAQETATATSSATILTPISIDQTADMNFGNVAVQSTTAGTVILSATGVRSTTGGTTLPATAGTVATAAFTVSGEDGYTYAITLPSSPLTISSGANNMTVSSFTSLPSGTGTLTGGSEEITVGATLNVAAAQASGTYISGTPFNVTVNYN
jgi:hypothetical protein